MRDRHVDDGDVEHFQHRGQHHGDDERDRRPFGMRLGEGDRARRLGGRFASLAALAAAAALRPAHFPPCCRRGGVDGDVGAGAHPQRLVGIGRAGDTDADREALRDLDPVAGGVLRRQHRERRARARADRLHHAVELGAGIHVEADGGGLARLDAGDIGLLEIGVDPPMAVLDQGEGRRAGLHDGARPQIAVGDPAAAGGGDMGAHPVVRRLVELGRRRAELHRRRGHGQLGVLRLGELGLGVVIGLQGVVPGLQRIGGRLRGRLAALLRVLGVAIFAERVLERDTLLLELVGGGFEVVGGRAGGGGRRVELRARIAQRCVVERGIDVEQRIAGGDLVVVDHVNMRDRTGDLRGHAHDVGASIGVVGRRIDLGMPPIQQHAADGDCQKNEQRHPAIERGVVFRACGCFGRSVLIHVSLYLGCGGGTGLIRLLRPQFKVKHGRMMTRLKLEAAFGQEFRCRARDQAKLPRLPASWRNAVSGLRSGGFGLTCAPLGRRRESLARLIAWAPSSS